MTRAPDGDVLATRLFEQHRVAVRRYLRRLTGEADLASDLTQDVYVRVVRGSVAYEPRERERAWVFRIARNVFLDHRKARGRRPQVDDVRAESVGGPAQAVRTDLDAALQRLDEMDRDTFLLCELGGLRYDEIAATLGLTVAGVRSRIYRTRLELRAALVPPSRTTSLHIARTNDDD